MSFVVSVCISEKLDSNCALGITSMHIVTESKIVDTTGRWFRWFADILLLLYYAMIMFYTDKLTIMYKSLSWYNEAYFDANINDVS